MNHNIELPRESAVFTHALRLALGGALFLVIFMILGAASASAAPGDSESAKAKSSQFLGGNGLISGLLQPVIGAVDSTLAHVPVVNGLLPANTVGSVTAPVTQGVDRVESALSQLPVLGPVVTAVGAPVQGITNNVVAPVLGVVDSVTTPVLGAVDQLTSPVVTILAPVLDPITGAVKPIVEDVTDTLTGTPGHPGTPGTPGTPGHPVDPTAPPTGPGLPGSPLSPASPVGPFLPGASSMDSASAIASASNPLAAVGTSPAAFLQAVRALGAGAATGNATELGTVETSNHEALPGGSEPSLCAPTSGDGLAGPCQPALGVASGASSLVSGSSGGSAGASAANEFFPLDVKTSVTGSALRPADWTLPSAMPSDPGASPD